MKAIYKWLSVAVLSGLAIGCDDFLERSAQNLIVPETIEHYTELLQGEAYFKDLYSKTAWVQFMTDDVEFQEGNSRFPDHVYTSTNLSYYRDIYCWKQEIENDNFKDEAYSYLYKQIKVANLCIEGEPTATGTDEEREVLLGQAYFTRAMAYFYLANLYAKAYNEADPKDLCVPLVLKGEITIETPGRATMAEVWGQITSDIENAIKYLKGKIVGDYFTINYNAALALATRIYLFMEDWDNTIQYGEELLEQKSDLMDITGETRATAGSSNDRTVSNFIRVDNPEIIWNFNSRPSLMSGSYYGLIAATGSGYVGYWLSVSWQTSYEGQKTLGGLYDTDRTAKTGDRRLLYWFIIPNGKLSSTYISSYNSFRPLKFDTYDAGVLMQCLRTGEVYVSLAEAYARRNEGNDATNAIGYLNTLREKRINPYTALTTTDFASNSALVEFCWDERRRELCFEEVHRWWDMRRQGQKKLVHRYNTGATSGNSFETFTLAEKDPAFVLDFPRAERDLSPALVPNSRPQRNEDK